MRDRLAAETDSVVEYAQRKLARKGCDAIIANDVSARRFGLWNRYQQGLDRECSGHARTSRANKTPARRYNFGLASKFIKKFLHKGKVSG